MNCFDGGNRLTRILEFGYIVLYYCLNCGIEMKGIGKRCEILHISWCLLHQFLPVLVGYLCISQVEKDVSELHLLWVITSLSHHLRKGECSVKL